MYFEARHTLRHAREKLPVAANKAVGVTMNIDQLHFPAALSPIVHKFNGKPVLVEKETRRYDHLPGVVELAVDIRGFNPVARHTLCMVREHLTQADVQIGFTIQGCTFGTLPVIRVPWEQCGPLYGST